MTARVFAATPIGFDGERIEVECDASNGLPTLLIVGLGNKAIDEAKERVRSAIKNAGLEFPRKRITINLAPANLPKDGAHFDLAIAVALLTVSGQLKQEALADIMLVGELALGGSLRAVRGVVGHAETARKHGLSAIIVPAANAKQAALVDGVMVLPANSLRDVYLHLSGNARLQPFQSEPLAVEPAQAENSISDVQGQEQAKRALIVAAAGGHNLLLSGPPGAGKTMLAKALASILPPLGPREIVEVTKLHSLHETAQEVITTRPFRSPHHSASHVALVGGGSNPRPGEISLAHRGVLFLDELPEYSRSALESLRQPLEDRQVTIVRAGHRATFPAEFMLVATRNPCPCGYFGDQQQVCSCSPVALQQYQKKISGPLLDRIDMVLEVSRVEPDKLLRTTGKPTQQEAATQVLAARQCQTNRFGADQMVNANMSSKDVANLAKLAPNATALLQNAARSLNLSARAYFKTIKVARTIADLDSSITIEPSHLSEALQYRPRSPVY